MVLFPTDTFQSNEFTKEQLTTMLRLMRENGTVFNLQGGEARFEEPILSEARLLDILQQLEVSTDGLCYNEHGYNGRYCTAW